MWQSGSSFGDLKAPRQCRSSLKMWFQVDGFSLCHTVAKLLLLLSDDQFPDASYLRVIFVGKKSCDLALLHYNAVFFVHISLIFEAHVYSECGVGEINHKSHQVGIPSLPVETSTRRILGDFINIQHHGSDGEKCLSWRRDCWERT